jgi:hypothetical protein
MNSSGYPHVNKMPPVPLDSSLAPFHKFKKENEFDRRGFNLSPQLAFPARHYPGELQLYFLTFS